MCWFSKLISDLGLKTEYWINYLIPGRKEKLISYYKDRISISENLNFLWFRMGPLKVEMNLPKWTFW